MKDVILNSNSKRCGVIQSDNSNYFSNWGSKKPELTINEEVDNQLSAQPNSASIDIINTPDGKSIITTYNDGIVPTPERMENMKCIGRTYSDKKGASICGVGQIEGLVAGRYKPDAVGTLTFTSINNGKQSTFKCVANGKNYTITTENSGPFDVNEKDCVKKIYEGMRYFDEKQIDEIKTSIRTKIYPYSITHPDFAYMFNGEKIEPIDILYSNIDDPSIKRFNKDYKIKYHNKDYSVKVNICDVSRYIKPNGMSIDKNKANDLDALYNMSSKTTGVFVNIGDSTVIMGGTDSWRLIDMKFHTTLTSKILIQIPEYGELKEALFAESPNKSSVGICLSGITDIDNTYIFNELINDIKEILKEWRDSKDVVGKNGKIIEKCEEKRIFNSITESDSLKVALKIFMGYLTPEQEQVLLNKKFSTIVDKLNVNNNKDENNE